MLAEFSYSNQPLFAVLTPPGRGAVAVVGVWESPWQGWNPSKLAWIGSLFSPANPRRWQNLWGYYFQAESSDGLPGSESRPGSFEQLNFYGIWKSTGEDVLLWFFPDRWEIHCHGGVAAVEAIGESLRGAGAESCDLGKSAEQLFGSPAFPSSPWKGALTRGLSRTSTERTARWMLAQWIDHDRLAENLIQDLREDHSRFLLQVQRMLEFASFGQHLTEPWSVVLCGPPNAGKSSLINALVGFERAIVHSVAGTTRDVVSQLAAVEGWPIELKDTAGLRQAEEPIEKRGIELSVDEIQQADLVLLVFTATETLDDSTLKMLGAVRETLLVCNKIDLVSLDDQADLRSLAAQTGLKLQSHHRVGVIENQKGGDQKGPHVVFTSALESQNLEELIQQISGKLVPELPAKELLIPIEAWQVAALEQVIEMRERSESERILGQLFGNHRVLE